MITSYSEDLLAFELCYLEDILEAQKFASFFSIFLKANVLKYIKDFIFQTNFFLWQERSGTSKCFNYHTKHFKEKGTKAVGKHKPDQ